MERPKNLYAQPMDMNSGADFWREWGYSMERGKGGKIETTVIAYSIKYILKKEKIFDKIYHPFSGNKRYKGFTTPDKRYFLKRFLPKFGNKAKDVYSHNL